MDVVTAFLGSNGAVILFLIAGIAFMLIEMLLPGFSVFGILGVIMLAVGIILSFELYGSTIGCVILCSVAAICIVAGVMTFRSLKTGRLSRSGMILSQTSAGRPKADLSHLYGCQGISITALHPSGRARFGSETTDVITSGEYIPQNARIVVRQVTSTTVYVATDDCTKSTHKQG